MIIDGLAKIGPEVEWGIPLLRQHFLDNLQDKYSVALAVLVTAPLDNELRGKLITYFLGKLDVKPEYKRYAGQSARWAGSHPSPKKQKSLRR